MGAHTALSIEQYLATSFPDLDKEYRDGELVERFAPDYLHELWLNTRSGLYRIPDVAVSYSKEPQVRSPGSRRIYACDAGLMGALPLHVPKLNVTMTPNEVFG